MERAQRLFQRRTGEGAIRTLKRCTIAALLALPTLASAQPSAAAFADVVRQQMAAGRIPGAVMLYVAGGRTVYRGAIGLRTDIPFQAPLRMDTIFDIASLTKPVATTIAVMQLVESGRLALDRPAADYWPAFAANGKAAITVRQLLTHSSGLPADLDLDGQWSGEAEALARTVACSPVAVPGQSFRYSDVNFIVLGELVARASGEPLERYVQDHIFDPLGMRDTGYQPPRAQLARIAPTDRQDGQLRWGAVQDPTAFRMGGIAGHAGLFSTAGDLGRLADMLLNRGSLGGVQILRPETVAQMTRPVVLAGGIRRALGWDMSSPYSAGMDGAFSPVSYGHTGYTGSLLWIDPATNSYLIILTSRLYPGDGGDAVPLRRAIAQLISKEKDQPAQ